MASSRDDFIIAIRSAFLKKSTQNKFSLLTLVIISVSIILLSSLDFKAIRYLKIGINEVVYRSSFIVSIPENFIKNTFIEVGDYTSFFKEHKQNKKELAQPTKVKTGGSTFINPKDQTNKKVWKLIKESVPTNVSFGDAIISKKHVNFFINKKNAKFRDMKSLIDYVKKKVKTKTGINLKLEIVIVE